MISALVVLIAVWVFIGFVLYEADYEPVVVVLWPVAFPLAILICLVMIAWYGFLESDVLPKLRRRR